MAQHGGRQRRARSGGAQGRGGAHLDGAALLHEPALLDDLGNLAGGVDVRLEGVEPLAHLTVVGARERVHAVRGGEGEGVDHAVGALDAALDLGHRPEEDQAQRLDILGLTVPRGGPAGQTGAWALAPLPPGKRPWRGAWRGGTHLLRLVVLEILVGEHEPALLPVLREGTRAAAQLRDARKFSPRACPPRRTRSGLEVYLDRAALLGHVAGLDDLRVRRVSTTEPTGGGIRC